MRTNVDDLTRPQIFRTFGSAALAMAIGLASSGEVAAGPPSGEAPTRSAASGFDVDTPLWQPGVLDPAAGSKPSKASAAR